MISAALLLAAGGHFWLYTDCTLYGEVAFCLEVSIILLYVFANNRDCIRVYLLLSLVVANAMVFDVSKHRKECSNPKCCGREKMWMMNKLATG